MSATSDLDQDQAPREGLLQSLMPVVVLTIICAVAGATLAGVKIGTAERIENQLLVNVQGPALQKMFPHAANNVIAERKKFTVKDGRNVVAFPVYERHQLRAVAIEGIGQGYGGDLGVMVGFNIDNDSLYGIAITISKETPGIGSEVSSSRFTKQFTGSPDAVALRSNGGEIDAISGATISSTGAVNGVKEAAALYKELKAELVKAWPAQQ
ncbi:FMN-binding protein [Desulfovibrio sp. OttesenSCG-928-C14]|nr:FMN-binding protein [Desulfovibrio sp. OttesenSCG-928-C14]